MFMNIVSVISFIGFIFIILVENNGFFIVLDYFKDNGIYVVCFCCFGVVVMGDYE